MSEAIRTLVSEKHGAIAESELSSAHAGMRNVAEAFGYTPEQCSPPA